MRVVFVFVCLFVAVMFLLLLNGQPFSNALGSLAFVGVALCLCAESALSREEEHVDRLGWTLMTVLMAMVVAGILTTLPNAYRFQRQFHQRQFNQAKQRAQPLLPEAVKPGL
jgi:hypothetical protein